MSTRTSIYDNQVFFEKYKEYREKQFNYTDILIWPALRSLLPILEGSSILDIGAGYGEFEGYAILRGAAAVTAIDNSRLMHSYASKRIKDSRITYLLAAVEDFEAAVDLFDLAVSSMTFHYVSDLSLIFRKIYSWLKPGGILVFSMNHPNYTAALCDEAVGRWEKDGIQLIDRYFEEGERKHFWLVPDVIKYHIRMETILNNLIDTGFNLERVIEPTVSTDFASQHQEINNASRTTFGLVVRARKPARTDE